MECEYIFKIILIGNTNVGKTCFTEKLCEEMFINSHNPTIGVDLKIVYHKTDDEKLIKCHIWDTAGQERFESITRSYYDSAAGIIFMFDTTNYESFKALDIWYEKICASRNIDNLPLLLVGTKTDKLNRLVSREMAERLANKYNMNYLEISSYKGENIKLVIPAIANRIKREIVDKNIAMPGIRQYTQLEDYNIKEKRITNRWNNCCLIS